MLNATNSQDQFGIARVAKLVADAAAAAATNGIVPRAESRISLSELFW